MIFKWRPIFRAIESALGIGIWAARARTGVMKRWSAWMPMQRTEPLGTMKRWIRIDSQCSKTLIRSVPVYLYGKASTSSLHAHASYRFRDWREPNHMIIYDWSVAVAHSTNPLPRQLLNTCALKSITLHAIFCTFQVAIATVNSKNALHVRSFGLYRGQVHRWGYDPWMLQINKLVSFDDHVWNEMFARLISVNYLSEVANFMWEQQLPAFFCSWQIWISHIGILARLQLFFFIFLCFCVLASQRKHLLSMWEQHTHCNTPLTC